VRSGEAAIVQLVADEDMQQAGKPAVLKALAQRRNTRLGDVKTPSQSTRSGEFVVEFDVEVVEGQNLLAALTSRRALSHDARALPPFGTRVTKYFQDRDVFRS
jgi:hypothetical protein